MGLGDAPGEVTEGDRSTTEALMRAKSIAISTSLALMCVLALGSAAQAKPQDKFGPAVDAFCGFDPPVYGKPYVSAPTRGPSPVRAVQDAIPAIPASP